METDLSFFFLCHFWAHQHAALEQCEGSNGDLGLKEEALSLFWLPQMGQQGVSVCLTVFSCNTRPTFMKKSLLRVFLKVIKVPTHLDLKILSKQVWLLACSIFAVGHWTTLKLAWRWRFFCCTWILVFNFMLPPTRCTSSSPWVSWRERTVKKLHKESTEEVQTVKRAKLHWTPSSE